MHTYLAPLADPFRRAADPANAAAMERYMKDIAPFLGIKTPQRRALLKAHIDTHGLPPIAELPAICRSALAQPEREWHYCAVVLLVRLAKKLGPVHLPLIEELITTKSWWDTVDLLASNVVGVVLKRHSKEIARWNTRWIESPDLWLNRTAILFQLKWKGDTERELLFANIRRHAGHTDFFIRKAIGWALRELSRSDHRAVQAMLRVQPLSPLSRREALRHMAGFSK
jgi:3-methyladenine DNA glycosylase AlkD